MVDVVTLNTMRLPVKQITMISLSFHKTFYSAQNFIFELHNVWSHRTEWNINGFGINTNTFIWRTKVERKIISFIAFINSIFLRPWIGFMAFFVNFCFLCVSSCLNSSFFPFLFVFILIDIYIFLGLHCNCCGFSNKKKIELKPPMFCFLTVTVHRTLSSLSSLAFLRYFKHTLLYLFVSLPLDFKRWTRCLCFMELRRMKSEM